MVFMYITVRKGLTGGKVNSDVEIFFSTGKESLFKARRELGTSETGGKISASFQVFRILTQLNGSAGSFLDLWAKQEVTTGDLLR